MAFTIERQTNEDVLLSVEYRASNDAEPFAFGVSNRAVYLPAKKTFAITNDPFYFKRVPLAEVRELRVRRLRPLPLYILSVVMVVVGLYTTIGMFSSAYRGRIRGWPMAVAVGGLVLPFAVRGRYALVVSQAKESYRWKPPLVIDRASKDRIAKTLTSIVAASRKAGLRVFDERT